MSRLIDAHAFKRYLDDGDECINCPKKKKGMFCSYHCELGNVESNQFARIIDEQPTIDAVEVVHGEWLRYGEDGNPNSIDTCIWQCDKCLETYYGRTERIPNYCPNCGAKMDGEVKSDG